MDIRMTQESQPLKLVKCEKADSRLKKTLIALRSAPVEDFLQFIANDLGHCCPSLAGQKIDVDIVATAGRPIVVYLCGDQPGLPLFAQCDSIREGLEKAVRKLVDLSRIRPEPEGIEAVRCATVNKRAMIQWHTALVHGPASFSSPAIMHDTGHRPNLGGSSASSIAPGIDAAMRGDTTVA